MDVQQEFSDNPKVELVPVVPGIALEGLVRSNMQWLAQRGYSAIEIPMVSGDGTVLYDSRLLLSIAHPGFDYDGQYLGNPEEGNLAVPEDEAKQKYRALQGVFPRLVERLTTRASRYSPI